MFDHEEEDRDLDSQVIKGKPQAYDEKDEHRSEREETPAPQQANEQQRTPERAEAGNPFDTPSSTTSEKSEPTEMAPVAGRVIPESALPTKLTTPPKPMGN